MKFNFDRNAKIKILLIFVVIVTAPYFAPFAIDFIILADFMGLEALLVLLFAYSKSIIGLVSARLAEVRRDAAATARLIVELPLFSPRIYFTHATASSVLAVLACSVFLACVVWVPVMVASMRYIS